MPEPFAQALHFSLGGFGALFFGLGPLFLRFTGQGKLFAQMPEFRDAQKRLAVRVGEAQLLSGRQLEADARRGLMKLRGSMTSRKSLLVFWSQISSVCVSGSYT